MRSPSPPSLFFQAERNALKTQYFSSPPPSYLNSFETHEILLIVVAAVLGFPRSVYLSVARFLFSFFPLTGRKNLPLGPPSPLSISSTFLCVDWGCVLFCEGGLHSDSPLPTSRQMVSSFFPSFSQCPARIVLMLHNPTLYVADFRGGCGVPPLTVFIVTTFTCRCRLMKSRAPSPIVFPHQQ